MEKMKFNEQELQNSVAEWLCADEQHLKKFANLPLSQQMIYKEKAKVILNNIDLCIKLDNDMGKYSDVIGEILQNWFVAIDVASNTLLDPDVAFFSGTITKDEAQGKNLPEREHSDLYLYLGQEGIDKIGAEKLLAYKDLPLEKQYEILQNMRKAVTLVASTENDLSKKAEEKGYSLEDQLKGLNNELNKLKEQFEKGQDKE